VRLAEEMGDVIVSFNVQSGLGSISNFLLVSVASWSACKDQAEAMMSYRLLAATPLRL
jgi:hypothetical protein